MEKFNQSEHTRPTKMYDDLTLHYVIYEQDREIKQLRRVLQLAYTRHKRNHITYIWVGIGLSLVFLSELSRLLL